MDMADVNSIRRRRWGEVNGTDPGAVPDHNVVRVDGLSHGAVAEPVAVAHHRTPPALQAEREKRRLNQTCSKPRWF